MEGPIDRSPVWVVWTVDQAIEEVKKDDEGGRVDASDGSTARGRSLIGYPIPVGQTAPASLASSLSPTQSPGSPINQARPHGQPPASVATSPASIITPPQSPPAGLAHLYVQEDEIRHNLEKINVIQTTNGR